jgi:hypothetical protein
MSTATEEIPAAAGRLTRDLARLRGYLCLDAGAAGRLQTPAASRNESRELILEARLREKLR